VQAKFIDVLHSPFVFELYQSCIKKELDLKKYNIIEAKRVLLKKDKRSLFYEDFGASNKSRETKVSLLANEHLKPARIAQILCRILEKYGYANAVELGTSLGITTCYLGMGIQSGGMVYTIEASEQVRIIANEGINGLGLVPKITSYLGTFDQVLPGVLKDIGKLDFLFIDGNHSYEATLRYFEMAKPYLHNKSLLVFDDIYWSAGMTKAWEEIKVDPIVTVTVDLFFVGLVYFRREQVKEHFKLRIF